MGYEDGEDLRSFKVGNINHVPNEWILTGSSLSNSVYMYLYKYIYIYIYICVSVCVSVVPAVSQIWMVMSQDVFVKRTCC